MHIVDREIDRAPQDMDIRAWRARLFLWSGQLGDAEREYLEILSIAPQDADHWMGLATVYWREGRIEDAEKASSRALELDPNRADLHAVRGRILRDMHRFDEAKAEFHRASDLDPQNAEARAGLLALRREPRQELRLGMDADLFSFADANQDGGISVTSHWTSRWKTTTAGNFYRRAGINAERFSASVAGKSRIWGELALGGAASHDNGVIPRSETFFDYDRGWKIQQMGFLRGLELAYGQHWYWYRSARILTLNEATVVYFPHDWTWMLGLTSAQSHFSGTGTEWRPSGSARVNFPIVGNDEWRIGGNVFFAVGTENFAKVDQIGRFSSHTYGGGLRLQLTPRQETTGFAAYQKRTQDRTEVSFGFTYGIRF